MEELYACACLCVFGFADEKEYADRLDRRFMDDPQNKFLLELEGISDDLLSSSGRLNNYFECGANGFDTDLFGRTLFAGLETAYLSGRYNLEDFACKCCNLFIHLPERVKSYNEAFGTLGYMDDVLLYNSEEHIRDLLEKAFDFYR